MFFFFSSRRRHTRFSRDWSSDVCSSDLGGKIVTGRKGVGRFEVFIKGAPAHAGTRPADGRSAIRELANVIQTLEALNDLKRGVTVNVGVVRGGTRPNVIPEEAYAEVDLRVRTTTDADELVA